MHEARINFKLFVFRCFACIRSAFHMGKDEMHHVRKLNHSNLIKQNFNSILLYYGVGDRWCPLNYYYDMRNYLSNDHFIANKNDKLPTIMLDNKGIDPIMVLWFILTSVQLWPRPSQNGLEPCEKQNIYIATLNL